MASGCDSGYDEAALICDEVPPQVEVERIPLDGLVKRNLSSELVLVESFVFALAPVTYRIDLVDHLPASVWNDNLTPTRFDPATVVLVPK